MKKHGEEEEMGRKEKRREVRRDERHEQRSNPRPFSQIIYSHWLYTSDTMFYLEAEFGAVFLYDIKYGIKRSRHDPGVLLVLVPDHGEGLP